MCQFDFFFHRSVQLFVLTFEVWKRHAHNLNVTHILKLAYMPKNQICIRPVMTCLPSLRITTSWEKYVFSEKKHIWICIAISDCKLSTLQIAYHQVSDHSWCVAFPVNKILQQSSLNDASKGVGLKADAEKTKYML
jgi:hypothetical protein